MQLRLGRNATWAVGEVVISGLVLFLLYRIVVATLGVEALGVWSLVMATTSLARFADLGAAAGLARPRAEYARRRRSALTRACL